MTNFSKLAFVIHENQPKVVCQLKSCYDSHTEIDSQLKIKKLNK